MTFWIGFFAAVSAVGELFGTWTVWATYRRSASFAQTLSKKLQHIRANEPTYDDLKHVFDITLDAVDQSLTPLKPNNWTYAGLASLAIGAVSGLVAALLALN